MTTTRVLCLAGSLLAAVPGLLSAAPALTLYNQNFAVVRDSLKLNLKRGLNPLRYADATAHLEPESVVLRDLSGKRTLQILEQNYRADPISQGRLLNLNEGKIIDFLVTREDHKTEIVKGRIVRSGYVPHYAAMSRYGQDYAYRQQMAAEGAGQPVIEVDGKFRFTLPGEPLFPALADDSILKPTLTWQIMADQAGVIDAELSYVTGGMSWAADYNVIAPEQGDTLDMVGWVTMDNQSGKTFENASIKLMAGDVSKVQNRDDGVQVARYAMRAAAESSPAVTEKTFDEYHLYALQRPATLRDRETKQVEFVRATGVASRRLYVYDGAQQNPRQYGYNLEAIRGNPEYGTQSNPKVWVMREFMNAETNRLGLALPKGKVRFYRRDTGGSLEFTGENVIDHTPREERVRLFTGNAFDVVGERVRVNFNIDHNRRQADESFEIKLRNRKKEAVEVRVVEHLYRATNWEIRSKSDDFNKMDSQTIEFLVTIKPNEEKKVTYGVHYTW
jgi:hypothetical protein